uniref:Uncharacterized protein n=1 Tax=viral metagenome TaxID=1070528 RepID=A0A6C0EZP0_9ZZZZ
MSHYKSHSRSLRRSHSKSKSKMQKSRSRSRRHLRRSQRGGSTIISPSNYSNQNNAHFSGIGFTDPTGAVRGCTGSTSSAAALKGADVFQTIGGIKSPVPAMKGGRSRKRILNKDMKPLHKSMDKAMKKLHISMRRRGRGRMHRGGSVQNTNGFSIGGVHLKPSLSGIANNYHTAYDSCKG